MAANVTPRSWIALALGLAAAAGYLSAVGLSDRWAVPVVTLMSVENCLTFNTMRSLEHVGALSTRYFSCIVGARSTLVVYFLMVALFGGASS